MTLTVVASKGTGRNWLPSSGPFHSFDEYSVGRFERGEVPRDEFMQWSDSLSFPLVPDAHAAQILRKMKHHPRFDAVDGFEFKAG